MKTLSPGFKTEVFLYHLIVTYLFKSYHISKGVTLLGVTSPVSVPSQLLYVGIYILKAQTVCKKS